MKNRTTPRFILKSLLALMLVASCFSTTFGQSCDAICPADHWELHDHAGSKTQSASPENSMLSTLSGTVQYPSGAIQYSRMIIYNPVTFAVVASANVCLGNVPFNISVDPGFYNVYYRPYQVGALPYEAKNVDLTSSLDTTLVLTPYTTPAYFNEVSWSKVAIFANNSETVSIVAEANGAYTIDEMFMFNEFNLVNPAVGYPQGKIIMKDDGLGADPVAGDGRFTSVPVKWDAATTLNRGGNMSSIFLAYFQVSDVVNGDKDYRYDGTSTRLGIINPNATSYLPLTLASGNIYTNDYLINIVRPPGFNHAGDAQSVFSVFPDNFDFINIFYTNYQVGSSVTNFHFGVKNEVTGIGASTFNNTAAYGSAGNLQGISVMPALTESPPLNHETLHQWSMFMNTLFNSNAYGNHHGYSTVNGVHGGIVPPFTINSASSVSFSQASTNGYSSDQKAFADLELYQMGALDTNAIRDQLYVIYDPVYQGGNNYNVSSIATVTPQNIVDTYGHRTPMPQNADTDFRAASVVISDAPLTDAAIAFYTYLAKAWADEVPESTYMSFLEATQSNATMETLLIPSTCTSLLTPTNGTINVPVDVALTWQAAPGNPTGYKLRAGTTPGGTDILNNLNVGNVLTYSHPGGFPFYTTIYVTVTAYDGNGDFQGCITKSFTTALPCTSLSFPVNGATNVPANVTVTWPAAPGNTIGYFLQAGTTPGGSNIQSFVNVGNVTSYTKPSGYPYYTTVYVKVSPYISTGQINTGCEVKNFTTVIFPCASLWEPSNGAVNISVNANLFWFPVSGASGYHLTLGTTPGGSDILNNFDVGNVTSYNPPGTFPYSTTIYTTIAPYNANGTAAGCAQQSFTTQGPPGIPACTALSDPLGGATNVPVTTALTWTAATGGPTGYRLDVGTTPDGTDILNNFDVGNMLTYDPPGDFTPNTTIYVKVKPYNAGGTASNCPETSFTTGACTVSTYYQDNDEDTYGNSAVTIMACAAPFNYADIGGDCDDGNAAINPGATETCNGVDDDCDTQIDEGVLLTFYPDNDGDTYGNSAMSAQACSAPSGYIATGGDCNDGNAAINPGATETCNGVDDNCDTQIDESVLLTFYPDNDGDTYGDSAMGSQACSAPSGYIATGGDCNDTNPSINPAATETCNGMDDNCDTQVDEGVLLTFYQDSDADTYGNLLVPIQACSAPSGYVADNTDCNDTNPAINPAASETCNGVDDDCDGTTDEGCGGSSLCGVYTIGGASPDFTTLQQAADALVANGITCPVTFHVRSGTYTTGATLIAVAGSSATNTITFESESGNPADVMVQDFQCFYLDGCDYVHLKNMSLSSFGGYTVWLEGSPEHISVTGNHFSGADSYGIFSIGQGCPDLLVQDNTFEGMTTAIQIQAGNGAQGVQIIGNTINDVFAFGIYISSHSGAVVRNNTISAPGLTASYFAGIFIFFDFGSGSEVSGNIISPVNGTALNVQLFSNQLIFNNFFHSIAPATPVVSLSSPYSGDKLFAFNSVFTAASGSTGLEGDLLELTLKNNVLASINGKALSLLQPPVSSDHNDLYTGAATLGTYLGTDYANLATWQAATSLDANSLSVQVTFSNGNPHSTQPLLGHEGTPVPVILLDIDGDPRHATLPDIGADEFTCPQFTFYADADGDTYGNPVGSVQACSAPSGYVTNSTDCDDANPAINPGASEVCNGVDDDCNGNPEAATNTWTGNGDATTWSDLDNWSDGIVPLFCQDVVIPAGFIVTVPAGFQAVGKTLDVLLSGQLSVDPTATLTIED